MSAFCTINNDIARWCGEVEYVKVDEDGETTPIHDDLCIGPVDSKEVRDYLHAALDRFLDWSSKNGKGYFYLGDVHADWDPRDALNLARSLRNRNNRW